MSNEEELQARMPRANNFDILRLGLAWMVVFYHAAILSAARQLAWIIPLIDGTVAVQGFFTISGCLIAMSFDQDGNFKRYLRRRAERILPAYYASTVFVIVLAGFLTQLHPLQFLASPETWKYLAANFVFLSHLHPALPGLFKQNPVMAVNGALWTIKLEVMFYLFIPVFFWLCKRLGRLPVTGALFVASLVYHEIVTRMGLPEYAKQLPGQLCFFMVGTAVYFYFPFFKKHRKWMWGVAIVGIALYLGTHFFVFRAVGVALTTMNIGLLLPVFKGPTAYGDFSYGTYVLHYPLIQALVVLGVFASSPGLGMAVCIVAVVILSTLSWNFVEKKFLRRKKIARLTLRQPQESLDCA